MFGRIKSWFTKLPERLQSALILVGLTGLVLASFQQVTHCDFISFDDPVYVTENYRVQQGLTVDAIKWAFTTGYASNWHPLTWISHMIDIACYGLNPQGHHFTNLLLHLANTLLLFIVFNEMTGALWRSAFVAALFGVHPMHVESVAWISERKDVLSAFFAMLTLLFYARYARGRDTNGNFQMNYGLAFVSFAAGLMSKPMLVTLPFVLLLLDWWPLARIKDIRESVRVRLLIIEKIPFFLLTLLGAVVTYKVQNRAGAVANDSPLYSVANALNAYVAYIAKLIWPVRLAVFYPLPEHGHYIAAALAFALMVAVAVVTLRFGVRHSYLLTGWFWFVGMLVPVIGFVQVGSQAMADRYTYLPSIGLFAMVAWAMLRPGRFLSWLRIAAMAIVIACATLSVRQVSYWRDSVTLFVRAVAVGEETDTLQVHLGTALEFCGKRMEAIPHFERAVQLNPRNDNAQLMWGRNLISLGHDAEAVQHLERALLLNPNNFRAEDNLGAALSHLKRNDEAEKHFRKALAAEPDNAVVRSRLAFSLMEQKKYDQAEAEFLEALRFDRKLQQAHVYLGFIYMTENRLNEALQHCLAAVRLNPDDEQARANLQVVAERKRQADGSAKP